MKPYIAEPVLVGHTDQRRTIYDLIAGGDAGGSRPLHNLAYFSPFRAGNQIGNHYHPEPMWETYLILAGKGVMHFRDMDTGKRERIPVGTELPYRISVPPRMGHTLVATTDMILLIGATDPPIAANLIKAEVL